MARPSPQHRPSSHRAGAPRAGVSLGRSARGRGAAGGACGPHGTASHALTQLSPGPPGSPRVSGLGSGDRCCVGGCCARALRARAKQEEARPQPSSRSPNRPAHPGRGRGGAASPGPTSEGNAGGWQRHGLPLRCPRSVRPPARRSARGAFEPRSRPPARPIGPFRGCVGGAGRTRGELRRWYRPSAGLPTPPAHSGRFKFLLREHAALANPRATGRF